MKILLTVPHAHCSLHDEDDVACDQGAIRMGNLLDASLKTRGHDTRLLVPHANIIRKHGRDANRANEGGSDWTQQVTRGLEWCDFFIDVHTCFPHCDEPYVLQLKGNDVLGDTTIEKLVGTNSNYILSAASKQQKPGFLMEYTNLPGKSDAETRAVVNAMHVNESGWTMPLNTLL